MGTDHNATILDVASICPEDFEAELNVWRFNKGDEGEVQDDVIAAKPVDRGRARTFHHAARIWAGLDYTRAGTAEWERQQAAAASTPDLEWGPASVGPPPQVLAPRMVRLNEVVDVTKTVDAPVLLETDVDRCWELFTVLMHRLSI